jgi:DNA-binding MarR family transcriptional regulator
MVMAMRRQRRDDSGVDDRSDLFQGRGVAFLLSQVGARSSRSWAKRLQPLGLDSRQVMLFWHVAQREGRLQRELADALGLPESRIVGLVDSLESEGLIERRTNPSDRRGRRLHVTDEGRRMLDRMMAVAAQHESEFSDGLSASERRLMIKLLERIANQQRLLSGVHPDF